MNTPRADLKLAEAGFFLGHLREERGRDARAFGFYLSAFLNAAYSMVQLLTLEAKTDLKRDAESKKRAKALFQKWYDEWVAKLGPEDRDVWALMVTQRRDEVHLLGARTVTETKGIPIEPPRGNPALFYTVYLSGASDPRPAEWIKEKERLGLPAWVNSWREAQVHHFEIAGERHDVVETCRRYLALLERLRADCHKSPLAAKTS